MPERDIESLGVMGRGLEAAENSSAAADTAAAVVAVVAPGGGRKVIRSQPRTLIFEKRVRPLWRINPIFNGREYRLITLYESIRREKNSFQRKKLSNSCQEKFSE